MTGALFSSISGYWVANMATQCVLSPGFSGLALINESRAAVAEIRCTARLAPTWFSPSNLEEKCYLIKRSAVVTITAPFKAVAKTPPLGLTVGLNPSDIFWTLPVLKGLEALSTIKRRIAFQQIRPTIFSLRSKCWCHGNWQSCRRAH